MRLVSAGGASCRTGRCSGQVGNGSLFNHVGGFATLWPWVYERIGRISEPTGRARTAMVDRSQVGTGEIKEKEEEDERP